MKRIFMSGIACALYMDAGVPGAAGSGGDDPQAALLTKIKADVKSELETRGYQDSAAVQAIVDKQLEGLNLEALRSFDAKMSDKIKNLAGEVEKLRNAPGAAGDKVNELRSQLESKMPKIELMMRSLGRDESQAKEIKFNVRAAAVMATNNTIDETTHNIPANLIESYSLDAFVPKRFGQQYIYEIADRTVVQALDQYKTWLEEGNTDGAFAIVAEGGLKPLVSGALVRNLTTTKKIAGKYVITEEFQKFRQEAYNIIRRIITDKLVREYSAIITADLQAQASGYVGTTLDDTIVAPNDYDAIGAVAAQIESVNFNPDVLILNPQDKWRIRLEKDDEGRYQFPVVTENGQQQILALRVVTSTYQTAGTFTMGESGLFKIEEEPITVRMGYGITVTGNAPVTSVVSDFDNNQMRIIVEMYFRDWIATNNIGSFVTASFATVKAALLKP